MKFRPLKSEPFPLMGGLDLSTIPMMVKPGRALSAINFEPDTNGGYRRMAGIERFDGRPSPSDAGYSVALGLVSGPMVVGDTLTGVTSGATAVVVSIVSASEFVVTKVVGTFVSESFTVGGTTYGTLTSVIADNETDLELSATYKALAADEYRGDIEQVPGSGYVRGVVCYQGNTYAFRDNTAATACLMYRATTLGWLEIEFGKEVSFTNAVGEIVEGNVVTGLTSGASGIVKRCLLRTGTWSASGVGTLVFDVITGIFASGEALQVGGATKVTSSSVSSAITLLPGGKFEFDIINFQGSDGSERLYCADGVNLLGEFDGTRWVPIRTGATVDAPKFVKGHRKHLVVGMGSSVMTSGTAEPYSWTVLTGASELATGQTITGLMPEVGDAQSGSMLVLTDDQAFMLYGNDISDFNLVLHSPNSGGRAYTLQNLGISHYLGPRGITQIVASQAFGNFQLSVLSNDIQTLIDQKLNKEISSCIIRLSNQYRIFFNDGTGLIGQVVPGQNSATVKSFMPFDYGTRIMNTVHSSMDATGNERIFGAGTDGYVYELERGTSLDGDAMRYHLMLHFYHSNSLRLRKNYHRTVIQLQAEGFAAMKLGYSLGFGKKGIPLTLGQDVDVIGGGSFWDQITDVAVTWDTPYVQEINVKTPGNGDSIAVIISGRSNKTERFTLQTCIPYFKINRPER